MKKILLTAGIALLGAMSFAQTTYPNGMPIHRTCGTQVPSQQWDSWFNQKVTEYVQNNASKLSINTTAAVAYTIPVIVHVIHGGQAIGTYPNISNAQVVSQINILTADFGGTGQYTNHYPATAYASYASANSIPAPSFNGTRIIIGNAQLTFLPTYYDQNNNALIEPGVDRVDYNTLPAISGTTTSKNPAAYTNSTSFMNFMNGYLKPNTIWNTTKFMNIWVTDEAASVGLLGFATFPAGSGLTGMVGGTGTSTTDGLWCWAQSYGNTGAAAAPYDLGRTATHEIGHWVGLRHIWGDGTCLTDYCNDTPPAAAANFVNQNNIAVPSSASNANTVSYPYNPGTCPGPPANGANGEMFMNFMDYSDDNAMYMFTTDQVTRIQTAMANAPMRNQLGTHGLTIPPPIANFSVPGASVCSGQAITVTDLSTGSPMPSSWHYTVTGATTSTSTMQSPVFTFTSTGTQTITLIATANGTANSLPKTMTVSVGTGITMNIASSGNTVCAGASATLTASGATTYTWNTGANTTNIVVSPTATSVYTVNGTSGSCSGSKTATIIVSGGPTVTVNSASICAGNSTTLTASGATTYSWNTGSTAANLAVSPAATTVYTVTGTTGGCTNVKTTTVTVNATPTVAVNSSTICGGSTATLTASGATTYSWNTGSTANAISVSPAATTVYTVTGANGTCTNAKTSTVVVNASPTVNVNSSTICSGNSATLTAGGATTYSWNTGSTANAISVSPAATTVYTITGTTGGCTDTKTSTVTVNITPTVNVNASTICSGNSATLTASGATTYSWNTGSTANAISVSPAATTVYTVTGANGACTNAKTTTVTVNATPTVNVNSSTICSGNSANLIASGATTYSWNTGSTAANISVSPASTTIYTVTGTTGSCTNAKTSTVTVNATPTVNVNSYTICPGGSATLTAGGASSYSWNTGSTANPLVVSPAVTTVYTTTGTTSGCSSSKASTVTIGTSLSIVTNPASQTICSGNSATLSASGATSYTWSTGAVASSIVVTPTANISYNVTGSSGACTGSNVSTVNVSTAAALAINASNITCNGMANGSATVTPTGGSAPYTYNYSSGATSQVATNLGAGLYTATVTTSAGCVSTKTFVVTQPPVLGLNTTIANATCGNCNGAVTYTANGGTPAYSYSFIPGGTSTNLCAGTYTVITMDGNGCTVSAAANVITSSAVNANSSSSNASCGSCANGSASVTATGGNAPYTYTWMPSGGNAATANGLTPGCYTVTVADQLGCTSNATTCVSFATGISSNSAPASFNIYPNPTTGNLTIELGTTGTRTMEVLDVTGRLIATEKTGASTVQLDLSPYSNGVYYLRIKDANGSKQFKVVKQ